MAPPRTTTTTTMTTLAAGALMLLLSVTPVNGVFSECKSNPLDYTVNFDIETSGGGTCTSQQASRLSLAIQVALNSNFEAAVTDWDGTASFSNVQLDFDGSKCSTSRSDLSIDCPSGKTCIWGCVTASTTMCGTPLLANWGKLGDYVQSQAANPTFQSGFDDCLGSDLTNQLKVEVIVNDPMGGRIDGNHGNFHTQTRTALDRANGSKEKLGSTESVTSTTGRVGTSASVQRPNNLVGPSSSSSQSSSQSSSSSSSSSNNNNEESSRSNGNNNNGGTCNDHAVVYNVGVDIQATATSDSCSDSEFEEIETTISEILNNKFFDAVSEWDGDVSFGSTAVDKSQEIDMTRRRQLQLRGGTAPADQRQPQFHRRLPDGDCPAERTISCDQDRCYWFCLIASTTNCGINSLSNWAKLNRELNRGISTLGYQCLGNVADLQVSIMVEDDTIQGSGTKRSSVTQSSSYSNGSGSKGANNGNGVKSLLDRSITNDSATKLLDVHAKMTITFFAQRGSLPTSSEITAAETAIYNFFKSRFQTDSRFASVFKEFYMTSIAPDYNYGDPDDFVLTFLASVAINSNAPAQLTPRQAAQVMANAPYRQFIRNYIHQIGGEFDDTFKIHFRGVSPAHRR